MLYYNYSIMFLNFLQIFQKIDVSGYCTLDGSYSVISFQAAPSLLLYSYIPAIIIALILSFVVFSHNKKDPSTKAFLFFSVFYSLWVINAILQWIAISNKALLVFWQFNAVFEIGFYLSTLYLLVSFLSKKELPNKIKWSFISIFLLILMLTPSILNIQSYDYENCEGKFGILWIVIYGFEFLVSLIILIYGIIYAKVKENLKRRKEILLFSISLFFFISLFTASNIGSEFLQDYSFELFGPIGMVIFIGFMAYLIIKYKTFNIKLLSTQALVWGLAVLIGSQFFFIQVTTNFILNGITFIGIIIFGQILIKSVRKEIEQRERLELLTTQLSVANEKLKGLDKLKSEFVSLASHQLRSPLTAIKGYTSMLMDGDYGEINPEAKEAVDRIMESSNNLTLVVEDLLNVTKIEQGGMKYEMTKFDFGELTRGTAKDLSITALKKGLKLIYNIPEDKKYFVDGDKEKLRQVLVNIIDNGMKYTKEGQIEVNLNSDNGKILLSIKDTGAGITKEAIGTLFKKFSRGDGGKMNTSGTGLGLYLVKEIVEAHKGRAWVESEGLGKGSTFFVELNEVK